MNTLLTIVSEVVSGVWHLLTRKSADDRWEQYKREHPEKFPTRFYPDGTQQP